MKFKIVEFITIITRFIKMIEVRIKCFIIIIMNNFIIHKILQELSIFMVFMDYSIHYHLKVMYWFLLITNLIIVVLVITIIIVKLIIQKKDLYQMVIIIKFDIINFITEA
jgi:hypothetical protein